MPPEKRTFNIPPLGQLIMPVVREPANALSPNTPSLALAPWRMSCQASAGSPQRTDIHQMHISCMRVRVHESKAQLGTQHLRQSTRHRFGDPKNKNKDRIATSGNHFILSGDLGPFSAPSSQISISHGAPCRRLFEASRLLQNLNLPVIAPERAFRQQPPPCRWKADTFRT